MQYKKTVLNFSEISKKLTGHRNQININYKGKKYKEFIEKCKDLEKQINLLIEKFKKTGNEKKYKRTFSNVRIKEYKRYKGK